MKIKGKKKIICENLLATQRLAKEILLMMKKEKQNVLLLEGDLGTGKTTFCQEVLRLSGLEGPFTSPTFVIMKKYDLKNKSNFFQTVYHIDCYRIGEKDLLDLGWKEIITDKKNLVLVEWPERIKKIWPERYEKINFKIVGPESREVVL